MVVLLEGLDIAEVDLIVLFDAVASPTRIVQRMGRTGRKRAGNVVMLVVDGTESDKVSSGHSSAASLCNMLRNAASTLRLCASSPRMIPPDLPLPVMRTEDFEISDFHLSQVGGNISKTKDLAVSKSKKVFYIIFFHSPRSLPQ